MQHSPERSAVRDALDRAVPRFTRPSETTFEGEVLPGAALVGPPGRLHGGLHPMLRVIAPLTLAGIPVTTPVHAELDLRASVPLGETTPFEGELRSSGTDFDFVSRFGREGRLVATAGSQLEASDVGVFADEYRACASLPEQRNILARGSIPTRVGQQTVSLTMDAGFFAVAGNEMDAYRMRDGGFDEALAGVALDLIGAVAVAFARKTHLFTTHLSLDFHVRRLPTDTPLLATASILRARPDEGSTVKPVDVRGELVPPTRVPVMLTDPLFREPYVTGSVTVIPVRDALVKG